MKVNSTDFTIVIVEYENLLLLGVSSTQKQLATDDVTVVNHGLTMLIQISRRYLSVQIKKSYRM